MSLERDPWVPCPCGSTNTTYALGSGGTEGYCYDCEDNFMLPEQQRPRRLQMMVDGQWDELRDEMLWDLQVGDVDETL